MSRCVGFAFGCALIVAVACQDQGATPPVTGKASPDTADQTLFGIRLVLSDHGVQRALLQADTAFTFEDNTRTELRAVRSTFYTETGVKDATLTSRQGTYNSRSGNMEARGNVVLVRDNDGATMRTEVMTYNQVKNEVASDVAFTFDSPTQHLKGIGFTADPDFRNVKTKNLTGTGGQLVLPR